MDWLGFDRRRLGTAMTAFGLVGVVMAGVMAIALVVGAIAARDLDDRLQADQARIGASLTRLSISMESLALTTEHASTTLETSSRSVADAQALMESTATTLVSVADALDVTILGSRPFASAADNLNQLARTVRSYETRAQTLAANLDRNASDAQAVAGQVRQLKSDVNDLATRVTGFGRIGELVALLVGGIVLAALLTAWIGLAAAFVAWTGWRMRRAAVTAQLLADET